ncbi:UNVERIFIED_CONTAM: GDSL esterase/lipase [Sesamum radiatum]|uniref:GDSL esterase/lipase n=1 Tax=Sesamum radiatum TaxID=300843 RepID=A0AAW2T1D5_SESRA
MADAYAILIILILVAASCASASPCYHSIISFGNSLTDTGNLLLLSAPHNPKPPSCGAPPYGRTFFRRPTGRFSDGRLVIDFIAESLGLPLVEPYFAGKNAAGSFRKGVNFAVAGATALETGFLEQRGIHNPFTNVSLGTQLHWFKQFLTTVPNVRNFLKSSLIMMGEIGGNDYNYALMQKRKAIPSLVPIVVDHIGSELIKLGAKTILVPGDVPLGCLPLCLQKFKSPSTYKDYDPKTGCLNWPNEFSRYHNELLQKELGSIRELYPNVTIVYADYFNAAMRLYLSPDQYGFTKGSTLRACCGAGGPYNFNESALCGSSPSVCCDNPSSFVSWDGIHYTEAAYRWIAKGLLRGPYTHPLISTICPSISRVGD